MRDPVAIVAPAVDVDASRPRPKAPLHVRVRTGRELIEARKAWPARGPTAKGWGEFLRDAGIEERTARVWMALAASGAEPGSEPAVTTTSNVSPPSYVSDEEIRVGARLAGGCPLDDWPECDLSAVEWDRDASAMRGIGNLIYFVRAGDVAGPIKVGFTGSLRKRLAALQTGCPHALSLLDVQPAQQWEEFLLHRHFAVSRTIGEWFNPHAIIYAYIRDIRAWRTRNRGTVTP